MTLTRLEAHRTSGVGWRSLRDGTISGDTPPVVSGDRFLYSDVQVTEFQSRMSGSGPFYARGDAGFGGSWSPDDGLRALASANNWILDTSGSYWTQKVPMESNDPWPGSRRAEEPEAEREAHRAVVKAAWCYMTVPSHPNRDSWRNEVKSLLLWTAAQSNHDFTDNTKYPIDYPSWAPSPIFAVAYWLTRLVRAYDWLGRESFSSAELDTLDRFFYGAANYFLQYFHITRIGSKVPNRLSFDFNTTHPDMTGYWSQNGSYHYAYDGSPRVSKCGYWNNRQAHHVEFGAYVANYFKFHGVTPPSGGTQPSYGWLTVDDMLLHTKVYVAEWLHFSVSPLGYCFDYHRGTLTGQNAGWWYASNEILGAVQIADFFARRGDNSVWDLSTTGGRNNTSGSPNDTPGVSGFPAKTIEFMMWAHVRYVNDAWGRRLNGSPLTTNNPYRDVMGAAIVSGRHPSNVILESAWKRSGNGFPPYPQTAEQQGVWGGFNGMGGYWAGLIEVGGV